jgi:hypothetical protein
MGLFFGAPRMLLIENLHHSVLISRNCCFHAMLRMSIYVILSWNIYINKYVFLGQSHVSRGASAASGLEPAKISSTGMSSTQF